jgi:UDP-N-acetylmuramyl pentapeptide phosphotransferase/UDP-N-acetylglucosamine-1-phosphate transferase
VIFSLLSEKHFLKVFGVVILTVVFFGLEGFLVIILLQWITRSSFVEDKVDKHGIAEAKISRLGGAVVIGCSLVFLLIDASSPYLSTAEGPLGLSYFTWVGCLLCALLGLFEDFRNDVLNPRSRLFSKAFIFFLTLCLWPDLVPTVLNISFLDMLLAYPVVAWLLTIIFCVGFLNASNMADGANGLMPGVFFITFYIFALETNEPIYHILTTTSGSFLIFNVISGRLFLGDAGTYGLGAAVVLSGLIFYNNGTFSALFMAVLLAYPCLEMVATIVRRILSGRSVVLPDNFHFHNRLHFHLAKRIRSVTAANSVTGLLIAAMSAGFAFAGYLLGLDPTVNQPWLNIFVFQSAVYITGFGWAGLASRKLTTT